MSLAQMSEMPKPLVCRNELIEALRKRLNHTNYGWDLDNEMTMIFEILQKVTLQHLRRALLNWQNQMTNKERLNYILNSSSYKSLWNRSHKENDVKLIFRWNCLFDFKSPGYYCRMTIFIKFFIKGNENYLRLFRLSALSYAPIMPPNNPPRWPTCEMNPRPVCSCRNASKILTLVKI